MPRTLEPAVPVLCPPVGVSRGIGRGSAPGRVNLIGEHTDHNGGLVLPTVIPLRTTVEVTVRGDALVRLTSESPGCAPVEATVTELRRTGTWADHVLGAIWAASADGRALAGLDGSVRSAIPAGAGLASSAALIVATLRALREAFALTLGEGEIASLAHRAETEFVGARVGRMDQLVCSLGREGEALFMDMRSGAMEPVPLAALGADITVIDSGIRHDHATGAYRERREECAAAARALGVSTLRDVPPGADLTRLPAVLARRVRHVTSEDLRVEAAVIALRAGDAAALGELLDASHASLRDDFEVSVPAIDRIVETAQRDPDCYGARITGGGFGGCVLLLVRRGRGRAVAARIIERAAVGGSVVLPAS